MGPSDRTEAVQVTVPAPGAANRDAARLLRSKGFSPSRVVDTQPDAILWVDQKGDARTTFVTREDQGGGKVRVLLSPALRGFLVADG